MNKYQQFWIMSKYEWDPTANVIASGYILLNGSVRIIYEPLDLGASIEIFNNFNELVNNMPNECYVVFDLLQ